MSITTVIFDIDGSLANIDHRIHHIKPEPGTKKNWGKFFSEAKHDSVYEHVKLINNLMDAQGIEIWICTGRPDNLRADTEKWLNENGIFYDALLMRPATERKPDYEVKRDIFLGQLATSNKSLSDVVCVFEDRLPVAKMWTELGLQVCVCGTEWLSKDWSD